MEIAQRGATCAAVDKRSDFGGTPGQIPAGAAAIFVRRERGHFSAAYDGQNSADLRGRLHQITCQPGL